jgi:pyruvate formate lyase activating enzyme
VTVKQLLAEIERDIPFYDQSRGGVTFTGGEPMFQRAFLREILLACGEHEIHTAVDTSGYTSWDGLDEISSLVNLFLYDLKLMDEDKHKKYTSVSNQIILRNLQKLSQKKAHIIVRIPVIPGINDDIENLESTASFLSSLPHLDGVELMPYHDIGLAKYEALGITYRLEHTKSPASSQIEQAEDILASHHLPLLEHISRRSI